MAVEIVKLRHRFKIITAVSLSTKNQHYANLYHLITLKCVKTILHIYLLQSDVTLRKVKIILLPSFRHFFSRTDYSAYLLHLT
jgi:hypothetical protein